MYKSIVNTIHNQCRTCLSESNNIRLLQDYISVLDSKMKIAQLIMTCASVEINTEDVLPNIICNICVDYASASFIFKRRCEESEKKLKSQLIKIEVCDSHESIPITTINESVSKQDISTSNSNIDGDLHVSTSRMGIEHVKDNNNDLTADINYSYRNQNDFDEFDDIPQITVHNELDATFITLSSHASYVCSDCPETFINKNDFRVHEEQHLFNKIHPEDSTECSECEQPFHDRKTLLQHYLTHSSYSCRPCKKRLKNIRELVTHSCEKELSQRTCGICGKMFGRVAHYKRHLLTHNDSVSACKFCQYKSKRSSDLTQHMKSSHENLRHVQCPNCDKRFFTKATMDQHRTIHTGQKKYICDYCGKTFDKRSLKEHIRLHTGERVYTCTICQKQFIQYGSLASHMDMHLPRQQHVCSICGKTSPRKSGLRIHMKRHLDERPFQCSVCSKTFKTKPELEKHAKIHTGETPHMCVICGKGFIQAQSLKAHMKMHKGRTG